MNKLTTKSAIIEKECQWIETSILPELKRESVGPHSSLLLESDKILVLIQGKIPVIGICFKYHDGSVEFKANGYNGNWNITHWMYIPTLPTN